MSKELNIYNYNMLNIMKFISSILVVVIHTSPIGGKSGFILSNIIAKIAVPFFFIVSGYFLYVKMENNKYYIKGYVKKY